MKQDMILILDLGSEENPKIAREIRALGVYTEIHPHDITAEELAKLPGVKGIILNGGVNRVVDGVEIDASEAVYNAGLPILKAVSYTHLQGFRGIPARLWKGRKSYPRQGRYESGGCSVPVRHAPCLPPLLPVPLSASHWLRLRRWWCFCR